MSDIVLENNIIHDRYTSIITKMFDVPYEEKNKTIIKNNIKLPENWHIGLIVGGSGSGKSTLLKTFGNIKEYNWDNRPIISNLDKVEPNVAIEILSAVGLSTIPSWLRPFNCLSNGEQFRAKIARSIIENEELILLDEFTSVVDRNVAKAASYAFQKYIRKNNRKVILASCHSDIIDWLQPDWIYNPTEGETHVLPRGSLQRPKISLKIFRAKNEAWELFKHHHYLNNNMNKSARSFAIYWGDNLVAFNGILAFPHARIKNAWRESRLVVLPDYQGLGIGVKVSNYFGSMIKANNGRYYSRTTHPAMIASRLKDKNWRVTSKGKTALMGKNSTKSNSWKQDDRECYSFEYIGPSSTLEEAKLFWEKI